MSCGNGRDREAEIIQIRRTAVIQTLIMDVFIVDAIRYRRPYTDPPSQPAWKELVQARQARGVHLAAVVIGRSQTSLLNGRIHILCQFSIAETLGMASVWLLCPRPGSIKQWCCLTSVCRTSVAYIPSAGGVCGRGVLADRARLGRPGSRLPLHASVAGLGGGILWRPPTYSLLWTHAQRASMLYFVDVFLYFFYSRLSWPNGWTDLHETFIRGRY